MKRAGLLLLTALLFCTATMPAPCPAADETPAGFTPRALEDVRNGRRLAFRLRDGEVENLFLRQGPVAAHVVISPGRRARVVVAFPAGDSGAALWLAGKEDVLWRRAGDPEPVFYERAGGGRLYGIKVTLSACCGRLAIREAVLGSIRVIRDHQHGRPLPEGVGVAPRRFGTGGLVWDRRRLDGGAGYLLAIEAAGRTRLEAEGAAWSLAPAGSDGRLRFTLVALTGDRPLTPIPAGRLLRSRPRPGDRPLAEALAFLSYREKLLAGSWRFLTYFGRDTLLSLYLLMPVLTPEVAEAGIRSVLARMNARGEVAHEEEIGEFAVLNRIARAGRADARPIYDYKMVDDDFLLLPVLARYARTVPASRVKVFLAAHTAEGERLGLVLRRNLDLVIARARPFTQRPDFAQLISLKPGRRVGNWRDSTEGLGGGRYPYDVNAALVPAALEAAAEILARGLMGEAGEGLPSPAALRRMAGLWDRRAPPLFSVSLSREQACAAVRRYAQRVDLPTPRCGDFPAQLHFPALAIDAQGRAIPVMHSDIGFRLLLRAPPEDELAAMASALVLDFPAGLWTPVGMLVANPAYARPKLHPLFSPRHYHGAVVWSWQQAVMTAGLARQLAREDIKPGTRALLRAAQRRLAAVIAGARKARGRELWSWSRGPEGWQAVPFRPERGHLAESNAVQLWSTVFLALPPARLGR